MILRKYKPPRLDPKRDAGYLAWLRSLPCIVCAKWRLPRLRFNPIEAAHVGERGIGQKCPDRQAAPLCVEHYRTGRYSHHALGKRFWDFWKLDRHELIADLNAEFERMKR
jgi:hypothetical protein